VVVKESSATLGYPGEETLPLNGDHFSIVKYDFETNPNYQKVSENLVLMIQDARKYLEHKKNATPKLMKM
jgi:hypothetical protein